MGFMYEGHVYDSLEAMQRARSGRADNSRPSKSKTEDMIDMIKDYLKDHTTYELLELISVAIKEHEGY